MSTSDLRIVPWETVQRDTLGAHSIFSIERVLRRSPSTGREHAYLVLQVPDWVNVIPVTPDGQVVLVEQFRHGTATVTLEIPGGTVDPGEVAEVAARRELEEETGYRPGALVEIGVVAPNPAFLSNRCTTYLALDCTPTGALDPDPGEEISTRLEPLAALGDLIHDGSITHALVAAAHDHLLRGISRGAPWAERVASWLGTRTP